MLRNQTEIDMDWKKASKYNGITPKAVVSVPIITGRTQLLAESITASNLGLTGLISISIWLTKTMAFFGNRPDKDN